MSIPHTTRTYTKSTARLALLLITALLLAYVIPSGYSPSAHADSPTIPAPTAEQIKSDLPNILVLATGGTLAGKASNEDPTSFQSYRAGTYLMEDLLKELPGKEKIADVSSFQFGNKGSGGYTIPDLYELSLAVDAALKMYDGAVVTTGTDTMEEIAYFLDLTVQSSKPVVVTGAMRPWDVIGTDGPANLYNAIRTAASGQTTGYGTVVMLGDVIHAAAEVTKSNSHRMDTFETPMLGALGYVDDPAVRMYRLNARALLVGTPEWRTPFDLTHITAADLPAVEIVYNYQQAGGGAIRAFAEEGVKGIVTAGTGAGGISAAMNAARKLAIEKHGVLFVSTTRTGSGSVYGDSDHVIAGDNLNAQHARMLLLLSLAFGKNTSEASQLFQSVGNRNFGMKFEETQPVVGFTDTKGHWGEAVIADGVASGWVKGYADNSFRPQQVVTRAELAALLARALGDRLPASTVPSGFTDQSEIGTWAKDAVAAASSAKLLTGYVDNSFRPQQAVTRAELAVLLHRALPLVGKDGDTASKTGSVTETHSNAATFSDEASIPGWAKAATKQIQKAGIMSGYADNSFRPANAITRAEAVAVLTRLLP